MVTEAELRRVLREMAEVVVDNVDPWAIQRIRDGWLAINVQMRERKNGS